MRKMIVFMSTGYAGMDACSALLVKDSATEDEIQEQAWQLAVEHFSTAKIIDLIL